MKRWPIINEARREIIRARYATMSLDEADALAHEWGVEPTAIRATASRMGVRKSQKQVHQNVADGQRRRASSWKPLARTTAPSMAEIVAQVAIAHGVFVGEVRGPSRDRRLVAARHEAMVQVYQTGKFSMPQVGSFFNRHHTSVLHAIRRHEAALSAEKVAA